jgi:Fanconi anemia group M protein
VLTVPTVQRAAELVAAMAKKEQEEDRGPPKLRYGCSGRTPEEQQRFLLEGLPQVSGTLATRLLDHFGSPAKVFGADQEALRKVKGIGPTTARAIHEVLHAKGEPPCQDDGSRSTRAQAPTTASGTGPKRSGS